MFNLLIDPQVPSVMNQCSASLEERDASTKTVDEPSMVRMRSNKGRRSFAHRVSSIFNGNDVMRTTDEVQYVPYHFVTATNLNSGARHQCGARTPLRAYDQCFTNLF